jgi:5-formyltetrahydrofolate cyclo-ligase
MSISSKKNLRESMLKWRNSLDASIKEQLSTCIVTKFLASELYKKAEILFLYYPLGNEVNVIPIIEQGLRDKKKIALPKVMDSNTLSFFEIDSLKSLKKGAFQVYEPINGIQLEYSAKCLILVPGIAFDRNFYRIGFGAGYYDRFFTSLMNRDSLQKSDADKIISIGVCYESQFVDDIYPQTHDIPLTYIITEKELYCH